MRHLEPGHYSWHRSRHSPAAQPGRSPCSEAPVEGGCSERRQAKGLSESDARRLANDPLYVGSAMLAAGEVEGCVAGAERTTADVLRSAEVGVVEVEYATARDLHRKYDIQAVPIVVIADSEGVVQAGFAGPVTAEDLWSALADVREQ